MAILNGMHALVTGAAGGIGREVVSQFLEQGASVTVHYRRESTLSNVKHLIDAYPDRVCCVQADVRDESQVQRAMSESVSKLGPLNCLVVNHAIFVSADAPIVDMSLEQWENTFAVNLTGTFLFIREFFRQLRAHMATLTAQARSQYETSVVMVGSTAGKFGEAGHADYASTKAAMMGGLMLSLKNEIVQIAPRGRVNCVNPGWTLTEMAKASVARGEHFKALQTTPLGKIATVQDIASAILFLGSPTSGQITGQSLMVDGGMEGRVLNTVEGLKSRL